MMKTIKFYLVLSVAMIGALLIVLSETGLDIILPQPYLMILGFVLAIAGLLAMKFYKQ